MFSASQTPTRNGHMTTGLVVGMMALAVAGLASWISDSGAVARVAIEQQRNSEIAAESRVFCEKWSVQASTQRHAQCVADLQNVRDRHSKRIYDDIAQF